MDRGPRAGRDVDRVERRGAGALRRRASRVDRRPRPGCASHPGDHRRQCRRRRDRDHPRGRLCEPRGRSHRRAGQLATRGQGTDRARDHLRGAVGTRGQRRRPGAPPVGGALRRGQRRSRHRPGRARHLGLHGGAVVGRGRDQGPSPRRGRAARDRLARGAPRRPSTRAPIDSRSAALGRVEPSPPATGPATDARRVPTALDSDPRRWDHRSPSHRHEEPVGARS